MSNKTALITGASKGVGKELAKIHAAKGDNLVIVSRSNDELMRLKNKLEAKHAGISILVIVKDLFREASATEIYNEVIEKDIQIDYLINNAGIGEFGFFIDTKWDRHAQMIDLNVRTLTHMCHLFMSDMIERKQGKILNISSTAAFQPGPLMAVYFASKSYVLHLSEALNNEVKQSGVSVTAFCPGPTDTHFMVDSKMEKSKLVKNKRLASSHSVALSAYNAMIHSKPVSIHGFWNKVIAFSTRFVPRKWVVVISRKMQV